MEWKEIADELLQFKILCIVKTRRLQKLYNLMPEDTFHLSRMMCSAHILNVIAQI
jgi:CRISPR-associated endonuclease/helicase Cas3